MKIIRLLYPDYLSGGLDTYYFGAGLLQYILPPNSTQPLIKVSITPPDGKPKEIINGINAENEVLFGIEDAQSKIEKENPDKIITIGGTCVVSLAPFDYLHGKYENIGIIWIDAHPDVSTVGDGYPFAHAMVLGSMLGRGSESLSLKMKNSKFKPDEVLYVGLQKLHDYQEKFLNDTGINYRIQDKELITDNEIKSFIKRFRYILVHFDVDSLDERFFHSTYFTNSSLVGDGSGGGKFTIERISDVLQLIEKESEIVGFTIAEYLPFDEHGLRKTFEKMALFTK